MTTPLLDRKEFPPRPERIPNESENETERNNRVARDQAEIRKVNEINIERRKKGSKLGQNIIYHEADQRVKSRLFFALGTEGTKRFLQSFPHTIQSDISFKEFFTQCEGLFKKEKNFIVERMHLYNTNQADSEGLESFFLRLSGQEALCGWSVAIEKQVVRDIFIAKTKFKDIQRELCIHPGNSQRKCLDPLCYKKQATQQLLLYKSKWETTRIKITQYRTQIINSGSNRNLHYQFRKKTYKTEQTVPKSELYIR